MRSGFFISEKEDKLGGRFNPDRAAQILVEAAYHGDKKAAKENGISERTIRNYRRILAEDTEFSAIFLKKHEKFEDDWASDLSGAIKAGIKFIKESTEEQKKSSPDSLSAVTDATRVLAEIALTKDMLDAKLADKD